jgi:hypothetical protein
MNPYHYTRPLWTEPAEPPSAVVQDWELGDLAVDYYNQTANTRTVQWAFDMPNVADRWFHVLTIADQSVVFEINGNQTTTTRRHHVQNPNGGAFWLSYYSFQASGSAVTIRRYGDGTNVRRWNWVIWATRGYQGNGTVATAHDPNPNTASQVSISTSMSSLPARSLVLGLGYAVNQFSGLAGTWLPDWGGWGLGGDGAYGVIVGGREIPNALGSLSLQANRTLGNITNKESIWVNLPEGTP